MHFRNDLQKDPVKVTRQKCTPIKNLHPSKMYTCQKCTPEKNALPSKMHTCQKCTLVKMHIHQKYTSVKNAHPSKILNKFFNIYSVIVNFQQKNDSKDMTSDTVLTVTIFLF